MTTEAVANAGARDLQAVMAALASPVRREILGLIWERELAAGEIAAAFDLSSPTISQHLSVLRDAGLVTRSRSGTFRRYRARQEVLQGLHSAVLDDSPRWIPADDLPERERTAAVTQFAVVIEVDVSTDIETTFRAFTDPAVYSRWLGVPVSIDGDRFGCTMEFGTRVRGVYDVVCSPSLVALRWDFEDDNVPVPGGEQEGYLRFAATSDGGTHVTVHQLVRARAHAEFMEVAWGFVLGRLQAGVVAASDPQAAPVARARRPKRRGE
jgi:DNA-binding transcriptional ArsR family regulator